MIRFVRFCLLVLVLAAVALASALTAMRLAIHGREVRVPQLAGLTQPEAEQVLAANGLLLNVENRFYSADAADGAVLSQYPAPNDKVRRGWRVRVAMSLGVQRSAVPDVTGESSRAAELNLRRRGFDLSHTASMPSPGTAETVLAQSPKPTSQSIATPKIDLLFAAPALPEAFAMPSFIGKTATSAIAAISAAGFEVTTQSAVSATQANAPPNTVFDQNPLPGAKLVRSTTITLSIAPSVTSSVAPPVTP